MLIFVSQIIVLALGVTIIMLAGWGMFVPGNLVTLVTSVMDQQWGIYFAVIVRLVLGAALIIAAPASPFPIVFQALGWIAIVAAVALALLGRERVRKFVVGWFRRFAAPTIRLWLVFGMAFGGVLIYGVL
jgi:hypothetical protein